MTRRYFLKRVGGVAASAAAVAALPGLVTNVTQEVEDDNWIELVDGKKLIESALIPEGFRLDPDMGVPYRFSGNQEWFTVTELNPPLLENPS